VNKRILIPAIALGLIVAAGASWVATKAANGLGNSKMAQTLSEKLGVDESTVTTALDEMREERQAKRQQEISDSLDKAVSDGVITAEQKQAWLDKQTEMQQWLKDNGIDESKLQSYLGKGMAEGIGRGRNRD